MKQYYIYLTTNIINNKKYIGKHYGLIDDEYIGSGSTLKAAIKKYGRSNFKKEILEVAQNENELNILEKKYIAEFNSVSSKEFYNLADGGTGGDTIKNLSPYKKKKRISKIKKTVSQIDHDRRMKINKDISQRMILIRKDAEKESVRIKNLKQTHQSKTKNRIKMDYASRSGGKSYNARKVITPLGYFPCAKDAAIKHNIHATTVLNRCKNNKFTDWYFV